MTSSRVAGVLETYWTQSWLSSVHSLQPVVLLAKIGTPSVELATALRGVLEV